MSTPKDKKVPRAVEQWTMFFCTIGFLLVAVAFDADNREVEAIGCVCAGVYLQARLYLTKGFIR